jgi:N6-adenosine-specific RNA methylase IME4/ParB-like chromosome segregation protein Spo0J
MAASELEFHPVADIFPMMSDREFADLTADIAEHGLREPVWLHRDGRIIDGRNRYRACRQAGLPCEFRGYEGDDDKLVSFVVSLNLHRRHLNESQRAMVAARIANMRQGARRDIVEISTMSQSDAADLLNVSRESVVKAKRVQDAGVPELVEKVEAGEVAVSTAAEIARAPETEQRRVIALDDKDAILAAAKDIQRQRKEERLQVKAVKVAEFAARKPEPLMNLGPFPVVYADPPWRYDYAEDTGRQIENHYPTMSLDDIKVLEVPAADDSVLFLWVTSPKLVEGFEVLAAWGFEYRTCMVWVKDKIGMGYYARQKHELLLIAKRGALPVPDPEDRPPSVFEAARTEHSAKPDLVYELIERMYPFRDRCELFQRRPREGWIGWGNQAMGESA